MKRKWPLTISFPKLPMFIALTSDPLKKREDFTVSLRKQKKSELITSKRKRAFHEAVTISSSFDLSMGQSIISEADSEIIGGGDANETTQMERAVTDLE